jgi:flavin reductase (DIM6/NTAB) family NADH-FMN oxidoreductase RutF
MSTPDPRAFRDCVGEFATGVTIVTVEGDGFRAGMTLNSFTSVSLDPLLVLVSLAHGSRTLAAVHDGGLMAINVLSHSQSQLALAFAKSGAEFPDHQLEHRDGWVLLRNSLAVMLCSVDQVVTAGDHDLVVGRVEGLHRGIGEPLVFHRGRLGGLSIGELAPAGLAVGGWESSESI